MSFLYEQAWWRAIVHATKTSHGVMAIFTGSCAVGSAAAGYICMEYLTNSSSLESYKKQKFTPSSDKIKGRAYDVNLSGTSEHRRIGINADTSTDTKSSRPLSQTGRGWFGSRTSNSSSTSTSRRSEHKESVDPEPLPFNSSSVMSRVNKERLQVLLYDVKNKSMDKRYEMSLRGKTKGTSSLSSAGNIRGIDKS